MKKILLYILLFLSGILIGGSATKLYHGQPAPAEKALAPDFHYSAGALQKAYAGPEKKANYHLLNKTIRVDGTIAAVYNDAHADQYVLLAPPQSLYGVLCHLPKSLNPIQEPLMLNDSLSVIGICFGKDENVRLENCRIVE